MKRVYLLLLLCASLLGCTKSNTSIPNVSTFFGRFNGFAASMTTANPANTVKASYIALNVPVSTTQSNGSYTSILSGTTFSISITKSTLVFSGNGAPPTSAFQGYFGTGSVPYLSTTITNGIAIGYVDNTGDTWNSATGDQTGSVFTITNSQPSGIDELFEAEFNCKLYDSAGNMITLTGGMFTGQFQPQ